MFIFVQNLMFLYLFRDLENLLVWLFVKETIAFLPRPFQEAKLDFDKVKKIVFKLLSTEFLKIKCV